MITVRLAIRLSGNLFIFSFSESLTKFRQQILWFGLEFPCFLYEVIQYNKLITRPFNKASLGENVSITYLPL